MNNPVDTDHSALSPDEIALAKRLLARLEAGTLNAEQVPPERADMVEEAKNILVRRKTRSSIFPPSMFDELVWELLLALYIADAERREVTIGGLIQESDGASTTALRWFDYLVAQKLVERRTNPADQRSILARITDLGRSKLEQYLTETLQKAV